MYVLLWIKQSVTCQTVIEGKWMEGMQEEGRDRCCWIGRWQVDLGSSQKPTNHEITWDFLNLSTKQAGASIPL